MTPLEFCLYLQNLATPDFNSFNMYANSPMFEKEAVIARKNLLRYLTEMSKRKPSVLLVGEAPGKDGCAISGIPFTSEYQLLNEPFFLQVAIQRLIKVNQLRKELRQHSGIF